MCSESEGLLGVVKHNIVSVAWEELGGTRKLDEPTIFRINSHVKNLRRKVSFGAPKLYVSAGEKHNGDHTIICYQVADEVKKDAHNKTN